MDDVWDEHSASGTRTVLLWGVGVRITGLSDLYGSLAADLEGGARATGALRLCGAAWGRRWTGRPRRGFDGAVDVYLRHGRAGGGCVCLRFSERGPVHGTGCASRAVVDAALRHLLEAYRGRGLEWTASAGFVADVVLAAHHFRLPHGVDGLRLREAANAPGTGFVACYEPLLPGRGRCVSLKATGPAPCAVTGRVFPLWTVAAGWSPDPLTLHGALALAPELRPRDLRSLQTLRVYPSGSVLHLGRWSAAMAVVRRRFTEFVRVHRARVEDAVSRAQPRITGFCVVRVGGDTDDDDDDVVEVTADETGTVR